MQPMPGAIDYPHYDMAIRGVLTGHAWLPAVPVWKILSYDLNDQQRRTVGKMTLRDHVLRATNDGDFQSCKIADGVLHVSVHHYNARTNTTTTKHRTFDLAMFPSIADMVDTEWCYPDEDESC